MAGKGDDIRPRQVTDEEWEENYGRTFGKKKRKPRESVEAAARRTGHPELPFPEK